MPIFDVRVSMETTMMVVADDEQHAYEVAASNAKDAFRDADAVPMLLVVGDVTKSIHLSGGWNSECVPYGGDGNTRLRDLLLHDDHQT